VRTTVQGCLWIVFATSGCLFAASQQAPSTALSAQQSRAILDQYCVTCHNERLRIADLTLDKMDVDNVAAGAEVWEKVVGKLRSGAMPPAGVKRPDAATYDGLAAYFETELDRAAAANPNPGRPAIHRLNRAEYSNAIRDLLALQVDAEALLPADDSSYGFDNIGDVLTVSPALLERYLSAAAKISRFAVGDPALAPASETYEVSGRRMQDEREGEDLPFGSRGGIAISHYFPLDAEYEIKIRLQRDRVLDIIGLAKQHRLDVRLDGGKVRSFTVGGGVLDKTKKGGFSDVVHDEETYERTADAGLELRIAVKAGAHVVGVAFVQQPAEPEGTLRRRQVGAQYTQEDDIPGVGSVSITGPFAATGAGDTPSRRRIFLCHPASSREEDACAGKILSQLARRAYRRPVTDAELKTLLSFYQAGHQTGGKQEGFEKGIEMALRRMLVSPEFLFRIESPPANVPAGASYRLSDLELASRLSFFLWSSIPDDPLLDLAERGKLSDPAVLEQQVRRMLADSRAKALISNFAGQWLYLRNMEKVAPDPEAFPDFDENLRTALQQETELFFEAMLRDDRPVAELLDADYTFLNDRLARHYGIPNVYGSHFRRVTLSDDTRKGLLGKGSILTVTSYPTRTSPTLRGKWLLENILGAPPPPPPANVPSLKDRGEDGQILSVRQQMEQHRKNPACAGCHARMDPLGFALENFDAIGRWRATSGAGNTPIDSSGVLPDGTKFEGPAELRKILLDRKDEFASTVTKKLLTYALGRGLEYYDQPTVRAILRQSAPSGYRWSSLILGVVESTPFQRRRAPEP
jgi:mono/diheme cytochrome c family protein